MMLSPLMMCFPSGSTKNANAPGFSLPVLSPMYTTTLVTLSTGVLRIACTCQTRFSSNPQFAVRKALTVSWVGVAAVKSAGLGLGKVGAAVGAGAVGSVEGILDASGACWGALASGAGGTCCWAAAWNTGTNRAISATALSKRANGRIKLFSLVAGQTPSL